jgi:hypothetical protein
MGLTRSEKAARMLQQRLTEGCTIWPHCGCHETLAKYASELSEEEKIWDTEVLAWAETSIFITLACIGRYCPDLAMKLYAKQQLTKGFWDRQKSMGIHVEQ